MLRFLRKYQKVFFIIVTVVIVVSFSFFGTQSTISPSGMEDKEIGKAIDKSSMRRLEIHRISRFLAQDVFDSAMVDRGELPNFFNDGVIRRTILGSVIGKSLVDAYFPSLVASFEKVHARQKMFLPYAHPKVPFIAVENIWGYLSPGLPSSLRTYTKQEKPFDQETFALLSDLYLAQAKCPPHLVRRYLELQCNQLKLQDPLLRDARLTLFNARDVSDWFGPTFLDVVSQFIHNGAIFAKQKGYEVSSAQACADLYAKARKNIKEHYGEIDQDASEALIASQMQRLGLTERECVEVWQKVLLVRELFEDHKRSIFLDPLPYQLFYEYAAASVNLETYALSPSLQLKHFQDFLNLQSYLDSVVAQKDRGENLLSLTAPFLSLEEVEARRGELVQRRFTVDVAQVKLEELMVLVGMQEMWDWQTSEDHFALLKNSFPAIAPMYEEGMDPLACLDRLEDTVRYKVDQFSRKQIVLAHTERIEEALAQKPLEKKELVFQMKETVSPLEGIITGEELHQLLQNSATCEAELSCYTNDGNTYFRFSAAKCEKGKELMTFQQASRLGILEKISDAFLQEQYRQMRGSDPATFQTSKGDWKAFSEVKEKVARRYYANVCEQIATSAGVDQDQHPDFYARHALRPYLEFVKNRVMAGDDTFVRPQEDADLTYENQWRLEKSPLTLCRSEAGAFFAKKEGEWTDIQMDTSRFAFAQVQGFDAKVAFLPDKLLEGQALLGEGLVHGLMQELLDVLKAGGIYVDRMDDDERSS